MTAMKGIRIGGCKESYGVYAFVDLSEPEIIGQHPITGSKQYCFGNPLIREETLEVNNTGKILIEDESGFEHAEVLIYCSAKDCPHHE